MALFVSFLIVTFPLIWISNAQDFHTSLGNAIFLQGVIAIKQKSKYVYEPELPVYSFQNIGRVKVTVKQSIFHLGTSLKPCKEMKLNVTSSCSLLGRTNFIIVNRDSKKRAIVYISNLNEKYMEEPEEKYDKIMILEQAFNLGVKYIRECGTLDILISYFWFENGDNVWKQIFGVIKALLTKDEEQMISRWIDSDIKRVKENLDILNNLRVSNVSQIKTICNKIWEVLYSKNIVHPNQLVNKTMLHFYILPLFSNFITLKMYFIEYAAANLDMLTLPTPSQYTDFSAGLLNRDVYGAVDYIYEMQRMVIPKIYNTVYAPGLYNIMICAHNHLALHGLDLIAIWKQIHFKIVGPLYDEIWKKMRLKAISYSKYYGRATPNLLQQAIHIEQSSLSVKAELYSISLNITKGIVCGLKLYFKSNFSSTMGTFETENDKNVLTLTLYDSKINQLKVYKTTFIRCLEFTLSDGNTSMYGDCKHNSEEYEEFKLKDHYINSLYLANDYTRTNFDNVAVSYLPKPDKVF